ncbi:MAG: peptidase [Sphingomonas sp.]|nr:peptidase [Sphingomonas sp.]
MGRRRCMSIISKEAVRKGLSAHAVIGLLASALLYVVCITGTLAVFHQETQRIEQPGAPEMTAIAPEAVQRAVANVLTSEPAGKPVTHLYVQLPDGGLPRTAITTDNRSVNVAPDGAITGPQEKGWSEFVAELHYTLMLPQNWGLVTVGALGAMMLALTITGVIAHPRIFRDAFRLRARHGSGVGLADWHNRLSVWTLPFSIAIALTGALIGLAYLTNYGLSKQFYGGDALAAYAPIFGKEPELDDPSVKVPDVASALRGVAQRFPDVRPYFVVVHEPGSPEQHVQVIARVPHRLIYGESYNFDAHGRFLNKVGMSDGSLGQQAAASNYNLHFGNFAGLPGKIAYFVFGAALCAIIATGPLLWLGKRRRRGLVEPKLAASWDAVMWGVPALMLITFAARMAIGDGVPFTAIFWIGLAVILIGAIVRAGLWARGAGSSG